MEINLPMSPPVNNCIQGNVYDKLDAVTFEKVRVANSLLETRRSIQERVINKYRKDVERVHMHQTERLRREYRNIRKKKPDYVFDDSETTKDRSQDTGRVRSLSDSSNCSFCRRYYSHHYNVRDRTQKKKEHDPRKHKKDEFFNMTLRIFFLNIMNRSRGQMYDNQPDDEHQDIPNVAHGRHSESLGAHQVQREQERKRIKPHSYDPRTSHPENEERIEDKRAQSVDTWGKPDDEEFDELKDLAEFQEENDVFASSLNTSKFSLDSSNAWSQPKPKLSHSMNVPSSTSIPEESKLDIKEDKELWKRSKTAFEKIFAGLL